MEKDVFSSNDLKSNNQDSSSSESPLSSSSVSNSTFSSHSLDSPQSDHKLSTQSILDLMQKDKNLAHFVEQFKSQQSKSIPTDSTKKLAIFENNTESIVGHNDENVAEVQFSVPNQKSELLSNLQSDIQSIFGSKNLKKANIEENDEQNSSEGPIEGLESEKCTESGTTFSPSDVSTPRSVSSIQTSPNEPQYVAIGIDYVTRKPLYSTEANGLAVMTKMNTVFEHSLKELFPIIEDILDSLQYDLNIPSSVESQKQTNFREIIQPRIGAVPRSERGRIHYYLHIYDKSIPIIKVFERLMLDKRFHELETIARIYPVIQAAPPNHQYIVTCCNMIYDLLREYDEMQLFENTQSSKNHQKPVLKIGLAIESHKASEFANEILCVLYDQFQSDIELFDKNPMNCDLILTLCFFNDLFLISLWDPINTNNLNNFRPQEMAIWMQLHPGYIERTPKRNNEKVGFAQNSIQSGLLPAHHNFNTISNKITGDGRSKETFSSKLSVQKFPKIIDNSPANIISSNKFGRNYRKEGFQNDFIDASLVENQQYKRNFSTFQASTPRPISSSSVLKSSGANYSSHSPYSATNFRSVSERNQLYRSVNDDDGEENFERERAHKRPKHNW